MATSAYQTEGMSVADKEELNELLELVELPEHESGHEMLMRLLKLVELLYNVATPAEGGEAEVDLALRAANAIVPLVGKIREQFDEQMVRIIEQDTTIAKLNDNLLQKGIELQRALLNVTGKKVESGSSHHSSQKEEEEEEEEEERLYAPKSAHLSTWIGNQGVYKENVETITHDACQYGQFVSNPATPTKAVTMAMPTADDSEKVQSRQPGMGADNQPSPGSSEADQSGQAIQRTSSEESLPQQAYDMTFPSGRGSFIRPGPVYERMPAPRTKPTQKISSGENLTAEERDATLCSQGSNDVTAEAGKKGSGPRAENDSAYGFAAYIQGLQSTDPQPLWATPKFLQVRKRGKFVIFDVLEWAFYTLLRVVWDLISGQLIAWWHLLIFLITTVLHLFTFGTGLLDAFHLPKLPVFIVPRLSWCIIATQVMFLTCLMAFLEWRRELDILLQANGLSRRYMLDYIYEESRMILFIGIDKGVFRLGISEPENLWRSENETMRESIIGLTH
ncbi:unnamed protein product [Clonostachys rosea f. rosea IK726]|uniref:Uncharacterized protein n=2 Tax=Clonostachys rosea f. rosea IK726 TaxID=1349383 RepID=A0ACA9TJ26_BIOOC|nr:unnamed protein product [Clonostachys rosea f. rosea IK726]CAG9947896.1 unnamed protein product [Clonostachys rosea f. rosea IK726]